MKNILLFKTNIQTLEDKQALSILMESNEIMQWTIDQQDVDCVLRIVSATLELGTVIQLLNDNGYQCEELI